MRPPLPPATENFPLLSSTARFGADPKGSGDKRRLFVPADISGGGDIGLGFREGGEIAGRLSAGSELEEKRGVGLGLGFFCGDLWCGLMDAGSKPEKDIKDVVKSLKIDPPSKASSANMSGPKDGSTSDATSCISSGSIRESEVDQAALMGEQGLQYYGYCYPGFNSPYGDWSGGQSYFVGTDGLEVQPMVIQADNGSLLYYLPGFQPGYTPPYNPVLPGPMIGVDGQYLGQESYYTSPIYQQPLASPGIYPQSVAYGPELLQAYPWDPPLLYADVYQGNGIGASPTTPSPKSSFSSKSHTFSSSKPLLPPKSNTSETKGSLKLDPLQIPALSKTSLKPENKAAGAVLSKGYFPIDKTPPNTHQGKGELLYTNCQINMKENGRSWVGTEKMKFRSKFQGLGSDLTNEQNRGPRTNNAKDSWITGVGPVGVLDAGKNEKSGISISAIRKDMYNLPDFPTKYDHALFFVIKSYSEDDIHKSIKYNVWASTPNGNKRLDNAFQAAQEKVVEQSSKCPVFLFFSVNASGQFCGVAEMIGRVNFNKNMDFWQQDKWNGFFPVKWHIIKDIPNPQFRHIILENNENKPVTNSRDTQEVKFPQGTEMLNIFKNYPSKTSILDDFDFYESRQKAMQDKRSKQPPNSEHPSPKTGGPAKVMDAGDLEPIASGFQSLELEDGKSKEELPDVVEAKE